MASELQADRYFRPGGMRAAINDRSGTVFLALSLVLAVIAFNFDPRIMLAAPALLIPLILIGRTSLIVFVLVAFAFLRLDAWMSSATSLPFGKMIFLLSLGSLAFAVFRNTQRLNRFTVPVLAYALFLLTSLAAGSVEAQPDGVALWFADTVYAVSYFIVIYMMVNSHDRLEKVIYFIVLLGIFSSLMNIAEFLNPAGMELSHSTGRAAGLLKNANTSAFVVNISMICSVYALRVARSRAMALSLVLLQVLFFFGVFTTFSREGILLFGLVFVSQFFVIRRRSRRTMIVLLAGAMLVFGMAAAVRYISTGAIEEVRHSYGKIEGLVQGRVDDNDRLYLLRLHLSRFAERPLTGNGLYSALFYSIPACGLDANEVPNGPHNTFVMILSEAGIFPLLAYLLFLAVLLRNMLRAASGGGEGASMRQCLLMLFAAFVVHHGFSHMILLSRHPMVLLALFSLPAKVISSPGKECQSVK